MIKHNHLHILIIFFNLIGASALCGESIIIGFDNFLVQPDIKKVFKNMTWTGFGSAALSKLSGNNPERQYFENLNKITASDALEHTLVWQGENAPPILKDFLTESLPWPTILTTVKDGLAKQALTANERQRMVDLAEITFDPTKNTDVMKEISEGFHFIETLIKQGHTVYILENWHSQAAQQLQAKFYEQLRFVQGIMVSGQEKMVKSVELYEKFFTKFGINPNEAILIETEPAYTKIINDYNAKHKTTTKNILCKDRNFKKLKKDLKAIKILK